MSTTYKTENEKVTVVDDKYGVIEEFESCGCIYRDLGTCQGCPTCQFDNTDERY